MYGLGERYWVYLAELLYFKTWIILLLRQCNKTLSWHSFFLKSTVTVFGVLFVVSCFLDVVNYVWYNRISVLVGTIIKLIIFIGILVMVQVNYSIWLGKTSHVKYNPKQNYKVIHKPKGVISIWLLFFFRPYSLGYIHNGQHYRFCSKTKEFVASEYQEIQGYYLVPTVITEAFLKRLRAKVGTKFSLTNNCYTL